MWIVRLALRRPYTIAVLCSLIAIFGLLSTSRMKTDILPAIDIPVVIVVWNYPGLSAQDMERRVVFISERAISTTVSGLYPGAFVDVSVALRGAPRPLVPTDALVGKGGRIFVPTVR